MPCALSTIIAGLAAGAIYKLKKGEFIGVQGAVLFAFFIESLHMGLTLLLGRPYDQALIVVKQVALPMILANTLGMSIFAFIIVNLIKERTTEAEKEMIESELKVAREIQMSIVPKMFPLSRIEPNLTFMPSWSRPRKWAGIFTIFSSWMMTTCA